MFKSFGFDLETIHQLLRNKKLNMLEALELRLTMLNVEIHRLEETKSNVRALKNFMKLDGKNDWASVFKEFHLQAKRAKINMQYWENYFSEKEQEVLSQLPLISDNSDLTEKWVSLVEEIRNYIHTPPQSDLGQYFVKQWLLLVEEMFKGDWNLAQKVWNHDHGNFEDFGFYSYDHEIVTFIEKAQDYFFKYGEGLEWKI
ncbi:hypothetical protein ACM26V_19630 [Salipaludibacillus sp. HK11]|uniref:hypothetical protein n=1 Tax=Salipaludibacillus sp. HK11 TaxID=3394320 RepID=UPI0039FC7A37